MDMKNNVTEKNDNISRDFATICLDSCRKLLDRIEHVKQTVLDEFHDTMEAHNQMVRLAVNEAEALAWETDYPHLVFPALAHEKAEQVSSWEARQREIRRSQSRRSYFDNSVSFLANAFSAT
jgi:hypothetical protein